MIETETDLLAHIVANPEDTVARLVYADWLEEHGQSERAEFVRVQFASEDHISKRPKFDFRQAFDQEEHFRYLTWANHNDSLRRRERELFERHGTDWLADFYGRWAGIDAKMVRGFVETVRCRLEDWIGTECESCEGTGQCDHRNSDDTFHCPDCCLDDGEGTCRPTGDCSHCTASGLLNAHGPTIVRAAPIRRARFTDKRASLESDGRYYFLRTPAWPDAYRNPNQLPFWFFDLLPGKAISTADYRSQEAADNALSTAAIAWARSIAFPAES